MSQQAYYGYDSPDSQENLEGEPQSGISVFTSWIGGLVSIGLVAGLGVWGYNISVRDVTAVPVIRAMVGPMRIAPEDPGGETTAYQGLAVNKVQADGGVSVPTDQVVLAPAPVSLTGDDTTGAKLRPRPRLASAELATIPLNVRDVSATTDGAPGAMISAPQDTSAAIDQAVRVAVSEAINTKAVANVARLPGVKRSPRPRPRVLVASLDPSAAVISGGSGQTPTTASDRSAVDVDPSTIVSGTSMVQLGAFDDRTTAIEEWNNIVGRQGDLIGKRRRFIQVAESGGRSFYRLRMVGFKSLADSRRLCSALLARGTPCIPVTAR